jgi:cation diffusion facilitator family transporter
MLKTRLSEKVWSFIQLKAGLKAVLIGFTSDLIIASIKFCAAWLTGSSAMASGGVHSLIDACTEIILFYGLIASMRTPTPQHQLGFGREIYFWNFIVAILIFALGSGVTVIGGLRQIIDPKPIENEWINYIVLTVSIAVEAFALWAATRQLNKPSGNWIAALRKRRDNTTLTIVEGDIAALIGLAISTCGLLACQLTGDNRYDGLASVTISIILAVVAFRLASNSKNLLIGLPVDSEVANAIISEIGKNDKVLRVNGMVSVHLAPDQLLVALSIWFVEGLSKRDVEQVIEAIDEQVRSMHPIRALFIEPQTPARFLTLSETLSTTVPSPKPTSASP